MPAPKKAPVRNRAPRDFSALRDRIISARADLPRRLAQIATYAIENPDEIAFGTAATIAEKAGVQPSTLVRLSQAIGYRGFSDFQAVFRERLRDRPGDYQSRLDALRAHAGASDAHHQSMLLMDGFCEAAKRSADALKATVDPAVLEQAIDRLVVADTIYLIGNRRSFTVAAYAAYTLAKLGVRSTLVGSAVGIESEILSFAGPGDAGLAVSFTPYAPDAVSLATAASDKDVPLVAITDSPFSPLAQIAEHVFEVVEADFEGFRSLSATMALTLTLAVAVANRRNRA
ncbi:MAG TPA: MurR/RpiR family transcriptional regulator [Afifellaceae bacterium]|nr:MurR/RpiR family transcriptional regulator [Afifellaceae bacterium]